MAKNTDEKQNIQNAISAFATEPLSKVGINLFDTLGYDTSLQAPLEQKTFAEFKEIYIESSPNKERFSEERAFCSEWKSIDILFQLTDDSFNSNGKLFESSLDPLNPQSYLCFAVELCGSEYTKTKIAAITREINKLFAIPIIIVFKYGQLVTLSVINRRVNKKDNERDVLEKVTLIKDIRIQNPHRAHVEILADMSLASLKNAYDIHDFATLHKAWSEVLDTQTLNKRFYTELSNWYFWAIKTVVYPGYELESEKGGLFTKEDKLREHNAKNLIRLLTRLLFVWFIKEKDLIPEELFDENKIRGIITKFNPEYKTKITERSRSDDSANPENTSIYYKAILQNLFFASLNAEQGKRAFRIDGQNQNATSLMRYQRYHKNPEDFVKLTESKVPFMNGGLFECLDHQDDELKGKKGGAKIIYEDGFSDRSDNKLFAPDYIFFGKDVKVDLSSEYDDKKKKDVTVNGIINILQKYKFTITENTPIEEDIALDPELLGRVFENLLASYNPETKTNARKQTGSFYTPRPIVEYMVDESLKAYLKTKMSCHAEQTQCHAELDSASNAKENALDQKLDSLIAYNDAEPNFTEEERFQILRYLDECKILDPACGSGAFPMGILQKMVYVIRKLDPENDDWKQIQIQKISNDSKLTPKEKNELQKEILTVFDDNEFDYARKLYLIENCIHGIDIQPIATQISRLRFFISLIVDQKVDAKKPNFGVRPLPNLENRFVTANSLIGLNDEQAYLNSKEIDTMMAQLQKVRHDLFKAKTPKYKFELRQQDKEIRQKLEKELIGLGFGKENARLISTWDPYDKNKSADFFDAEWMYGIKDGFDIVIGNPPYGVINKKQNKGECIIVSETELNRYKTLDKYKSAQGGMLNIFRLFIIQSVYLLKQDGVFSEIFPLSFACDVSAAKARGFVVEHCSIISLEAFPERDNPKKRVFENAKISVCILTMINRNNQNCKFALRINKDRFVDGDMIPGNITYKDILKMDKRYLTIPLSECKDLNVIRKIFNSSNKFSDFGKCNTGEIDMTFCKEAFTKNNDDIKMIRGANIDRYIRKNTMSQGETYYLDKDKLNSIKCLDDNLFSDSRIVMQGITGVNEKIRLKMTISKHAYCANSVNYCSFYKDYNVKFFLGLLNSKLMNYVFKQFSTNSNVNGYEVDNLPIILGSTKQQNSISTLVDKILAAKKADSTADTSKLEAEIDRLVYALYGLTNDEIKIVEGR